MDRYWLTQRLGRRTYKREGDAGLDVEFELDYMGSSEFEWGAIPAALKELRTAADQLEIHETMLSFGTDSRVVYFICDKRKFRAKRDAFDTWIEGGMRGQEASYFREVFKGEGQEFYGKTVAWWAIDTDVAWTLDPEVATLLLAGLRGPAFATV